MVDVMFYEIFREEEAAIKKWLPKSIKAGFTWETVQEQKDHSPPSSLICVRTQSRIPTAWANILQGILTRSLGFDHLVQYRRKAGADIPCGFLSDYCSRAVAEHAVMAMMVLLKKFKNQMRHFENFDRNALTGKECCGQRAVVIGVGNIGSQIVFLTKALGMSVKGVDIVHRMKNFSYVSLKEGLGWADVIFCALPLTKKTKAMLNYEALRCVRPGAIFINIARGEISPLKDLKKLLKEKKLGALSLDVYENENALAVKLRKRKSDDEIEMIKVLAGQDNVLFTPHNAFNTQESVDRKARKTVESIVNFLKHGRFLNPVPTEK